MRQSDFVVKSTNNFRWLTFPVLEDYNFLWHGFIIKNSDCSADGTTPRLRNFFNEIAAIPRTLVSIRQVHKDEGVVITSKDKIKRRYQGDAILTYRKDIVISVQVADCVPIFMVEEKRKVVGLIHAGWKGTLLGTVRSTMEIARDRLDCKPTNFTILFGPCIRSCCYQVSDGRAILFDDKCTHRSAKSSWMVDLICANQKQFLDCGVKEERMFATIGCTGCNEVLFHSYRREKENAGRMIGFLGLK
jgi:YfiH family protein